MQKLSIVVTVFMAWSPTRRSKRLGDSRLITPDTSPPSIPTNPATGPFEVSDDGFDGGASSHLALDLLGHAPLLASGVDPEAIVGRRVVAAIAGIGEDACRA